MSGFLSVLLLCPNFVWHFDVVIFAVVVAQHISHTKHSYHQIQSHAMYSLLLFKSTIKKMIEKQQRKNLFLEPNSLLRWVVALILLLVAEAISSQFFHISWISLFDSFQLLRYSCRQIIYNKVDRWLVRRNEKKQLILLTSINHIIAKKNNGRE